MKTSILLSALALSLTAAADFSFTYRGRLDLTGHAPAETLPMRVSAYPEATGGAAAWTGDFTVRPNADGLFQVQLSGADLEAAFKAGTARWLGVAVNGGEEHYPRQQILVAPVATRAELAEGLAKDASVGSLETPKIAAGDVSAGAVTVGGKLTSSDSGSTLSVSTLGGAGNRQLKGRNVQVFAAGAPVAKTFDGGVTEGDTLLVSDRGGLVTLVTDDNWTAPCVTWFVGAGEVKAPFSASGRVRVYHYPFGAN